MDVCKRNKTRIILALTGISLIIGGVLVTVFSALFLKEPIFLSGDSSGMILGFSAVSFGVPGMLHLIQCANQSDLWMIQLYAAVELLCIMASGTTFVALRSGIIRIDTSDCIMNDFNITNCVCSEGNYTIGCDEIEEMQTMSLWVTGIYMLCLCLMLADILRSLNKVCCTDEIPDIPGVVEDDNE